MPYGYHRKRTQHLRRGVFFTPASMLTLLKFFLEMSDSGRPVTDEVELLLTNAQLRDELEPYRDESIDESPSRMSLEAENEYLASMLAWERAPALPIHSWFDPPLNLPALDSLNDEQVRLKLRDSIYRMFDHGIVLRYTEHLAIANCTRSLFATFCQAVKRRWICPARNLSFTAWTMATPKHGSASMRTPSNADDSKKNMTSTFQSQKIRSSTATCLNSYLFLVMAYINDSSNRRILRSSTR